MKSVSVQVPGKILLAGEYAVLEGHPALSVAVDRFLTVTLTETDDEGWILHSDLWPAPRSLQAASAAERAQEPLFQVAEFAERHFGLPNVRLTIQSELDIRFGLGSSTALRLGVLVAAAALAHRKASLQPDFLLEAASLAFRMQRVQQSFASGYDVLTQTLGGLILWTPDYQNWPGSSIRRLPTEALHAHLQIFVGGTGAPTQKVGGSVREALAEAALQRTFYAASDRVVESWLLVLQNGVDALPALCEEIAAQRRLFAALPYFPKQLFRSLETLPGFDQAWTAKTTGAGGEDAILLIGAPDSTRIAAERLQEAGWYRLPAQPYGEGVKLISGISL